MEIQQAAKDLAHFTESEMDRLGPERAAYLQGYDLDTISMDTGVSREDLIVMLAAAVSVHGGRVVGDQSGRVIGGLYFGD